MSTILRLKSTAITVSLRAAVAGRIGLEGRQVDDRQVRHVAGELVIARADAGGCG